MSFTMTLAEGIKGRLGVYGMNKADIEECMSYIIQKLNQEDSLFKQSYSTDVWRQEITEIDTHDLSTLFHYAVLPEVVRWLAARHRAQTDILQEIHRLSSLEKSPSEKEKEEKEQADQAMDGTLDQLNQKPNEE